MIREKIGSVLQANPNLPNHAVQLRDLLMTSGLFPLFLENAKVRPIDPRHPHYADLAAGEAHRVQGYMEALYDILEFKERYLLPVAGPAPKRLVPDFGANDVLVRRNIMTQEEVDGLNK